MKEGVNGSVRLARVMSRVEEGEGPRSQKKREETEKQNTQNKKLISQPVAMIYFALYQAGIIRTVKDIEL